MSHRSITVKQSRKAQRITRKAQALKRINPLGVTVIQDKGVWNKCAGGFASMKQGV